jgi:hypothetical protein
MSKIVNPVSFSGHFGVPRDKLAALGTFDPILNADTKLFVDPLLLEHSKASPFGKSSRTTFTSYFETIIKLIVGSNSKGDVPWKAAGRKLQFPEVRYQCLGYGGTSTRGSGGGEAQTAMLVQTASEIVALGITDPDLFIAMALFEEGIGPDRISDMTCKIIMGDLITYTQTICSEVGVPTQQITFKLTNGETFAGDLPVNPYDPEAGPIILVPQDVLRDLPVASDWESVGDAASKNAAFRSSVNEHVAGIWAGKARKDKATLKDWALSNDARFRDLLDVLKGMPARSYDFAGDPNGEVFWVRLLELLKPEDVQRLEKPSEWNHNTLATVVEQIIENFRHMIEDRRYSEELYHDGKPRAEKAAQRIFFLVAQAFCKANDLDLTPEADTGNGPVDFKISSGFSGRALVEIKLSTNGKLVAGYTRQLDAYATAEEAKLAYYLIVDVGGMGNKYDNVLAEKNIKVMQGKAIRPIFVVDATRKPSASKL